MSKDLELLAEISYRYYIDELTQNELAIEFGMGRSTISRLLQRAKDEGVVEFNIKRIDSNLVKLRKKLLEKYDLDHIDIIDSKFDDFSTNKNDNFAYGASSLLPRYLTDNSKIGISWGETISKTVHYTQGQKLNNVDFIPLVGGPSNANNDYHINTIVYELSKKFQSHSIFINASVIQEDKLTADNIMKSQYFNELIQYWNNIDVAIVGIGGILSVQNSQWRDLISEEDYEFLKLFGAVGDLCCRFIDIEGNLITGDLNDRTVGIEYDTFKRIPKRIGIARSKQKVSAIKGLLNNNVLNHLITDIETAKLL